MTAVILALLLFVQLPTAPEPQPDAAFGVKGTASHVGYGYGRLYLALPEHRWGRPGIRVRICDVDPRTPGDGCVTMTSTDAGPSLAMQRAGRVADLSRQTFEAICGCDGGRGLITVTVTYGLDSSGVGPVPTPPATDTAPAEGRTLVSGRDAGSPQAWGQP